jgi:hypothetical protein
LDNISFYDLLECIEQVLDFVVDFPQWRKIFLFFFRESKRINNFIEFQISISRNEENFEDLGNQIAGWFS